MPLTPKQQRFVDEYLVDLNATQAAIRAGYSDASAKSVAVQASRLLSNANVRGAIAAGTRAHIERVHVTADDIVRRAWEIAQQDRPDRTAALALLARRHPEFSDKHDIKVEQRSASLQIVANMPLERLKQLAAGLDDEEVIDE